MKLFRKRPYIPLEPSSTQEEVNQKPIVPEGLWKKCPSCGKKVLIATSYCLSCKKKVKGPDKKKEDDDEKDKEDKEDKDGEDKDDKDDDEKKKDKDKDKDDKDKEDEKKKK